MKEQQDAPKRKKREGKSSHSAVGVVRGYFSLSYKKADDGTSLSHSREWPLKKTERHASSLIFASLYMYQPALRPPKAPEYTCGQCLLRGTRRELCSNAAALRVNPADAPISTRLTPLYLSLPSVVVGSIGG